MDITKREITKIAREVAKFTARTMKADGIGVAEFDVVHTIRKNPGITQAEICKILGADKGAVAKQTINLEAKGYIRRAENPADGRSQIIFATEKAERLKLSKAHTAIFPFHPVGAPSAGYGHGDCVREDMGHGWQHQRTFRLPQTAP